MPRQLEYSYEELVDKAHKLFWTKGYKSTTADELSDYLGVSKSVIYNKFPKDALFIDSINHYMNTYSDPFLSSIRNSEQGLETIRNFFYALVDALLDRSFPRSCLIVNTVVEMRKENDRVNELYEKYFNTMRESYRVVLKRAHDMGEVKQVEKIDQYSDLLVSMLYAISVLYKVKPKEELIAFVDQQVAAIR